MIALMMSMAGSPLQLSRNFLRSWSQYSNTSVSLRSLCSTSSSLPGITANETAGGPDRTMFGCWSSLRIEISRSAVHGTPCIE